jgi:hypothetical protein
LGEERKEKGKRKEKQPGAFFLGPEATHILLAMLGRIFAGVPETLLEGYSNKPEVSYECLN